MLRRKTGTTVGRWLLALSLLALLAAQPARAQQDGGYRAAVEEAVAEFSAGRWSEARALFMHAHAISPNARTFRGLGMTAFELRMYAQAIEELEAALGDTRKPLSEELRTQVLGLLADARKFVGTVRIEVVPVDAQVRVDGKAVDSAARRALALDAGEHAIGVSAPGHRPENLRVHVEGGRADTVRVQLERTAVAVAPVAPPPQAAQPPPARAQPAAAPPQPARASTQPAPPADEPTNLAPYAWVTASGAVAFGIAAAAFWAVGDSQFEELERDCAPHCSDAEIEESGVETSDALTNAFLGLSLLSGATSIVLFAMDGAQEQQAPLRVELRPGGMTLGGRF